jgi:hypothetical protein
MKAIAMPLLAALTVAWSGGVFAQVFKCADAAGDITYSSTRCGAMGLKDAGEIRDRLTVIHVPKTLPQASVAPPPEPIRRPRAEVVPDAVPPGALISPPPPIRR